MAMKASTAKLIASDFATLDLQRIRRFIVEAVAAGAIAELIAAIIGLLTRMRDLNQELSPSLSVVAASPDEIAGEHPIHQGAIGQGDEVLGSVQGKDGSEDARRSQRELSGARNRGESADPLEVAA
jgi:hypothetical protein